MYEHESAYHRLRITEANGVRQLRFERSQQSSMRLDDPYETDIHYIGYLHVTLAVKPDAARTLVIGLGGGSVVKRMWRDYPWMRVDAVEIDPDVVEVARAFFELPPDDERLRVTVGDGRAFVSACATAYDIIIVDAFDDDRVPVPLTTEEFMHECRESMSEDGVIAWNLIGAVYGPYSKPFRSFYRTVRNVWRNVWMFPMGLAGNPSEETRNIVLLASDADVSSDALRQRIMSRIDGRVTVPGFERYAEDLYCGSVRMGDVPMLVDERRRGATR